MSKINIPTCILQEKECDILFKSIVEKLNIQNPRFYYPIYNKIIDNANDSRGLVFDSKFKVCEILSKVLDTDSDTYETDDDANSSSECEIPNKTHYTFNLEENLKIQHHKTTSDIEDSTLEEILNKDQDVELIKAINQDSEILDDANDDSSDYDMEINDAINNFFSIS